MGRRLEQTPPNQIVLTWADGAQGLSHEQLQLMTSTNGGASFTGPRTVPLRSGDRPYYRAPGISPDGSDVYITYNAVTTPYQDSTALLAASSAPSSTPT
jgi:hypothetical protein